MKTKTTTNETMSKKALRAAGKVSSAIANAFIGLVMPLPTTEDRTSNLNAIDTLPLI